MGVFDRAVSRRAFACWSGAVLTCMTAGPAPANVRVTEDGFAAHIEPALAVNPRDARNLLAACRVFTGEKVGMAAYASFDGGVSWHGSGMLPGLEPDFCGNATVAFDGHGHGFVCGVVATGGPSRHGDARIWRTDDGGRSFHPPVTAITGGAGLVDHPSLAIGRTAHPHPSPLYIAASMYGTATDGLVLARSLDGGRTFEQPRRIDPATGASAVAPVLAAGPADVLTVVYIARSASGGVALRAVASYDRGGDLHRTDRPGPGRRHGAGPRRCHRQERPGRRLGLRQRPYVRGDNGLRGSERHLTTAVDLGNYQGLAAVSGQVHPVWTDTCTGDTQIFTATVRPGSAPSPR
ncbi:sialidase family protein [Streptomyces sp. NPDC059340]|uniref:sialidase family protein n=1 Tax=Streptomyces sp. NPDC059340 TaxID=3346806 RepID=UPI0036B40F77